MSARRALVILSQILPALTVVSAARAESRPLQLATTSQCPSRELIEQELAPLLGEGAPQADPSTRVEVVDAGESYRISVGIADREVHDPKRDCRERAKVSAVFIALNLPARRKEPQAPTPSRPSALPAPPAVPASRTQIALQLLGSVEHAPELSRTGKGLHLGTSLRRGPVELTLSSGLLTPLSVLTEETAAVRYELWRLPTSLTLGFSLEGRVLSMGVAGGLAVDVLSFRGVDPPNPDSGLRVNPGLALALPLKLHASRRVAAVLLPTLALFPRTYLVRIEPSRQVDETPRFWVGVRIGLEVSILGG